jgi:hypothetical protein
MIDNFKIWAAKVRNLGTGVSFGMGEGGFFGFLGDF